MGSIGRGLDGEGGTAAKTTTAHFNCIAAVIDFPDMGWGYQEIIRENDQQKRRADKAEVEWKAWRGGQAL
jgi:hypothetical protein